MASIPRINEDSQSWLYITLAYAAGITALFLLSVNPGLAINDEVGYLLMTDSLSKGSLSIWNGMEERVSRELELHATVLVGGRLYGVPAPLYPFSALPAYLAFGIEGLFYLNVLCFGGSVVLVYLAARELMSTTMEAAYAAFFYATFTYMAVYGLELWPHMLSVFLVLAAYYIGLSGRFMPVAGFLAGLSVGIRYSNALLLCILAAYILRRRGLMKLGQYLGGCILPLLAVLLINAGIYGGIARTGYNTGTLGADLDPDSLTPYLFLILAAGAATYLPAERVFGGRRALKLALASVAAVMLLAYMGDGSFADSLWKSTRIAYAEVFDMQSHPAGDILPMKKGILQASPILALVIFAPILLRGAVGGGELALLGAPAVALVVFHTVFLRMHGGDTWFMRYVLEAMPFLALLTALSVRRLVKDTFTLVTYALLCSMIFLSVSPVQALMGPYPALYLRLVPAAIVCLLAVGTVFRLRTGRTSPVLFIAIAAALAFGFTANVFDCVSTYSLRQMNAGLTRQLDFVKDDSAVMVFNRLEIMLVAPLKTSRMLRLVDTTKDAQADAVWLFDAYRERGVPVYVIEANSTAYARFNETARPGYLGAVRDAGRLRVQVIDPPEGD